MTRYSRQTILPEVGPAGQKKITAARVLVAGAGGLGCPALQYLAAAGIGTIGIADPDTVDLSNLQRQTLYKTEDQGRSKALMAKERLLQLNPEITINTYAEALTEKNIIGILSGYDIVIDGTDNFPAKFLINDAAVKTGKTLVYGAIQGFDGQASVFGVKGGPCYRCLYPAPPASPVQNCAEAGIIGAVAGIIGTIQAMETIKIIIGDSSFESLAGRLWMIDARTMETRTIKIPKKKDCPVCSKLPAEIVLSCSSPVCFVAEIEEIDCVKISKINNTVFIDVRELDEWEVGHIEYATHLPLSVLEKNTDLFTPPEGGKTCILYCQKGMRSKKAATLLLRAGYTNILSLTGGYEAWKNHAAR